MSWKYVVWQVIAPFMVCVVVAPLFAPAQGNVAAGINQQTLKAAAELKRPERLRNLARLAH